MQAEHPTFYHKGTKITYNPDEKINRENFVEHKMRVRTKELLKDRSLKKSAHLFNKDIYAFLKETPEIGIRIENGIFQHMALMCEDNICPLQVKFVTPKSQFINNQFIPKMVIVLELSKMRASVRIDLKDQLSNKLVHKIINERYIVLYHLKDSAPIPHLHYLKSEDLDFLQYMIGLEKYWTQMEQKRSINKREIKSKSKHNRRSLRCPVYGCDTLRGNCEIH